MNVMRRPLSEDVATYECAEVREMNPNLTEIPVVNNDDTGLLAKITSLLFEHDINIEY